MKKLRIPVLLLLSAVLCALFPGCASSDSSSSQELETAYTIYYRDIEGTGLLTSQWETGETDQDTLLALLWGQLTSAPEDASYASVVPSDTALLQTSVDSSTLSLYFDRSVADMDTVEQLLFRAGIVCTLTQIDGIESVQFYSDGSPLTSPDQTPYGAQSASDYVDIFGRGVSNAQKATLVLYYSDEDGHQLVTETVELVYDSSYSLEQDILRRLTVSDEENGCYATLPENIQIISTSVRDGVCYVNFDSSFISDALPLDGDIIIYSIVNSLCELPDIRQVQILVDGESSITFKGNISLSSPLERNLNY
ncbi:MAG: GerMN domain-containing protein [Lachnospiraceae bacterium]